MPDEAESPYPYDRLRAWIIRHSANAGEMQAALADLDSYIG